MEQVLQTKLLLKEKKEISDNDKSQRCQKGGHGRGQGRDGRVIYNQGKEIMFFKEIPDEEEITMQNPNEGKQQMLKCNAITAINLDTAPPNVVMVLITIMSMLTMLKARTRSLLITSI